MTMKTFFTALLIITVFNSLKAQWYMAAEDGICFQKIKYQVPNSINPATTKSTTLHYEMISIGAKCGYEFNPFVIELDGKLNIDMTSMIGIYSGMILNLNDEHSIMFTPLIGISLDHNFGAAARLQYKHFFLEANKTGHTTSCFIGIKCYVYE
jgi:hypothetical protein